MRRFLPTLIAAALALTMAAPAAAQAPETLEVPFWFGAADGDYLLLVNMTADEFCAWAEADFAGAPPVEQLVAVRGKETGKGAFVISGRAMLYAELWEVEDGELWAVCAGAGTLLGTGTVRWVMTDNDFDVSLTRMNSFGDITHGVIRGADGRAWRVMAVWRAQIAQDGEFRVLVDRTMVRPMR